VQFIRIGFRNTFVGRCGQIKHSKTLLSP